jgi:hypothetical protein
MPNRSHLHLDVDRHTGAGSSEDFDQARGRSNWPVFEFQLRHSRPRSELPDGFYQQAKREDFGRARRPVNSFGALTRTNACDLINQLERHFYKPENALA